MSDTTEPGAEQLRSLLPIVDAICRQIEDRVDASEREVASNFAEIFLSRAPTDFLEERSPEDLTRIALGALAFLKRGSHDTVDVEIFNPDEGNEGWYAPVTVIRTNVSERPFIVDTIREFLHSMELGIEHIVYPVLHVGREEDGAVSEILQSREGQSRESLVHCEVPQISDARIHEQLRTELRRRLQDVVRVTDDFRAMLGAVEDTVALLDKRARDVPERREEIEEIQEFLGWLRDGGFVFMGYRGYDVIDLPETGEKAVIVEPGSGLGILRNEAESAFAEAVPVNRMPEGIRELALAGPILIISKTNAESTVHRRARMDYIGVKKLDSSGSVVGEHRFIGLFTSKTFSEEAQRIPILRKKLEQILASSGVREGSHDYKEIITIFNTMPKEELFITSVDQIGKDIRTVLTSYHTDSVLVSLREDPLRRGGSAMVILPKDKFSGDARRAIEAELVTRAEGEVLNYHLALGSGDQARLHFYLAAPPGRLTSLDPSELETEIRELIRSWTDRLQGELERIRPADESRRLAKKYGKAFGPEYRAATEPADALRDVLELEAMDREGRDVSITLWNRAPGERLAGGEPATELKLYLRGERLVLSDFMPILENVGLRVIAVTPFRVGPDREEGAIVYSFSVQDAGGKPLDVEGRGTLLADTIYAVRAGDATNDSLNALVLGAGLAWREVDVIRAYVSYGFQFGAVPSRMALPLALMKYPEAARLLFRLFERRFDPDGATSAEERQRECEKIRERFREVLAGVVALADDRALRRLAIMVDATLRTNYFRNGGRAPTRRSGGVPYISFKFNCRALDSIVRTRLMYEVWVRSSRMEGVHLRGAKVARGGIRHSDRPDDFRTEVLGLVNTQVVKNAVIVPSGSKGGFITLRRLADRAEMAEEVARQYRTLMRGLLDLTDNIRDGETVPPEGVVCYDEPDPYLVVAADKGTAQFSDVANEIAAEYGFWLGDAFASGGSNGYDHKKVGITARGGWECVRRHFWEMGKDIQSEPFTVAGIGDMSGDVFGNGMLLSRRIRLVAAFDHRDIFIDPDPDPETSFVERQRMFALGRSSWDDYDRSVLGEGGMIVPRGTKEVGLTPEARVALGVPEELGTVDGEALIRIILKAPVELLWNGGIGTYVKASTETHADVGDASNDAVRINANELRAKVVGEGGNLGLTQRARVEFALLGGRSYTDALDNSGGVDLSDREVNLKILLDGAVASGKLTKDGRNGLLDDLEDNVAELVLADNRSQSLAVSLDELRAQEGGEEFRGLMWALEREGFLRREDEALPTWETLLERREQGKFLTRPELAVLLAYAKLHLTSLLLKSSLPDDPATVRYLLGYFPPAAIQAAGQENLQGHRLRREIVATQLTNDLVNLMGAGFVQRLVRDSGRSPDEIARAWLIAARLAGAHALMGELEARQRTSPASVIYRWALGLARVLDRTARWLLAHVEPSTPTPQVIDENADGLASLREAFPDVVQGDDRRLYAALVRQIKEAGAEQDFARNLITLRFLDQLLEILLVARETGTDPIHAAKSFYRVSEMFSVPWLREGIFASTTGDGRWEHPAAQALADDLARAHHRLTTSLVALRAGAASSDVAMSHFLEGRSRDIERYQSVVEEMKSEGKLGLAGATVAVREISLLASRTTDP